MPYIKLTPEKIFMACIITLPFVIPIEIKIAVEITFQLFQFME
jgi:hypothetical protein